MTSLAGSSEVFWGGVVTYSDEAKIRLLGVPVETIALHGAVSGAVALAMVGGLQLASGVPLAVSVTGVAGPGGGSPEKPVGTVWFGLSAVRAGRVASVAVRHGFVGSRFDVQRESARWARVLAWRWWDSEMELDSLRSLTDNQEKPFVEASQPPTPFVSNPL